MTNTSTCLLLSGLLALAGSVRAQAPTFAPVASYPTGNYPQSIAVADVNGDGKPDLLTANEQANSVGVLLGNGNGTFQPVQTCATGPNSYPADIAVADVNGDNKPDLLTANSTAAGVLLGNGNGTFQPIQTYSTGGGILSSIAVADVNGDGKPDLLTAYDTVVGLLLGNGNGTFQAAQTYSAGTNIGSVYAVAVADVNGDSKPDLLTANTRSTAGVLLGNGNGTFQAVQTYSTGLNSFPADIAVADVNGDNKPDLFIATTGGAGAAAVLLGNGNGTFQAVQTYAASLGSSGAWGIAVGDVNSDGKPDLLTANLDELTVGVLLGTGTGTFRAVQTYSAGGRPRSIAVADVNGDGKPDLLTANFDTNTVGVLLNTTLLATRAALPGVTATLAPNPATNRATLTLAGLPTTIAQVQATVLDATGRVVRWQTVVVAQGADRAELNIAGLTPGLYVVRLVAQDRQGTVAGELPAQHLSAQ